MLHSVKKQVNASKETRTIVNERNFNMTRTICKYIISKNYYNCFRYVVMLVRIIQVTQPAYNVGMTLIISCIYVATSNNTNATFSQRLIIDVTRTWKFDVATTLKSSRQPNPTSSQRLVINVIRTWKFDILATL